MHRLSAWIKIEEKLMEAEYRRESFEAWKIFHICEPQ
jgi:hypothetical protein